MAVGAVVADTIAPHFSQTRYKPWPRIEAFVKGVPKGSIIADIGESARAHLLSTSPFPNV